MQINDEDLKKIESEIDNYMFNRLNKNIPRYKFIYHMNLAYINFVTQSKILFTVAEKHFLFSLSYNTFLAYKKLPEEEDIKFELDNKLLDYCFHFLISGMQYSILCDLFPALHSKKAVAIIGDNSNAISIEEDSLPRKQYDFLTKYTIKKALSYTLQMISGKLDNRPEEEVVSHLTKSYLNFWNENMLYDDFEPYSRTDWGGINYFFTSASMRRFIKLYRKDFKISQYDLSKMMIVISPKGVDKLVNYTLSEDKEAVDSVLNDFIYKPLGKGLFPKTNISDAPIIRTKNGYLFMNPLVLLFNDSSETRLLNNLRKYDNERHQRIKDKLKERTIPIIEELVKIKYPKAKIITNFKLPIPGKKNQDRELDILIIDDDIGLALYIEVKHFFNPVSYSETKNLDGQLQNALEKTKDQLYAIEKNWGLIKQRYDIKNTIREKKAIILSHQYLGKDIKIHNTVPIVNVSTFYESLASAETINDLYFHNKEIDDIYNSIELIKEKINFNFAGYDFIVELEALNPLFERQFIHSFRNSVWRDINFENKPYKNIEEYAQALLERLNND
ncbi:hypothetical protein Q0N30_12395 [Priestia megaterium]|uniref:hypothetical protein n=1 Tax=Priestia megaterium TaxID=1404 RepID=UPI00345ABAD2